MAKRKIKRIRIKRRTKPSEERIEKFSANDSFSDEDENFEEVNEHRRKRKPKIKRKNRKRAGFFTHLARITALLLIAAVVLVFYAGNYVFKSLDKIQRKDIGKSYTELCIDEDIRAQLKKSNVKNIALFGTDVTDEYGFNRSDTIIIMSIDKTNNKVYLTSILRDTYVLMPGYNDMYKINTAYFFGGEALAVQTLNRSFDMDISDFVTVDFNALWAIVDAIGGLDLDISEEEADEMNRFYANVSPGTVHCTGEQVLTYTRIRALGNSDFDRVYRQRTVLEKILAKVKGEMSLQMLRNLQAVLTANITTSMSDTEILQDLYYVYKAEDMDMASLSSEEYFKLVYLEDGSQAMLPYSLENMAQALHSRIYPSLTYTPGDALRELSDEIEYKTQGLEIETIYTGNTIGE